MPAPATAGLGNPASRRLHGPWLVLLALCVCCQAGRPDPAGAVEPPWPTFQGNPSHNGYVPTRLDPSQFVSRWEVDLLPGIPLNPVAAAGGLVFVSARNTAGPDLFALAAEDGQVVWAHEMGEVYSVNPPAYGYGRIYIQCGLGATPPLLRVFDADSGAFDFQVYFAAQWEHYYAPTVLGGGVYIAGGYYGGMYAFDAFERLQHWVFSLGQYDQWTPAVTADHVFAYSGESPRGLVQIDRITGSELMRIADPNFVAGSNSFNFAPVLGGLNDVLLTQAGRLVRFDLSTSSIAYDLGSEFSDQPAAARGVVYVLEAGVLTARVQTTGSLLWQWLPPAGALAGSFVVTDSHAMVCTGTELFAVDLLTHEASHVASASGHLALSEGVLYVAGSSGRLTAVDLRRVLFQDDFESGNLSGWSFSAPHLR